MAKTNRTQEILWQTFLNQHLEGIREAIVHESGAHLRRALAEASTNNPLVPVVISIVMELPPREVIGNLRRYGHTELAQAISDHMAFYQRMQGEFRCARPLAPRADVKGKL